MTTTMSRTKTGAIVAVLALVLSTFALSTGTPAGAEVPNDVSGQVAGKSKKAKVGSANYVALVFSANSAGQTSRECHGALISPQWVLASATCRTPGLGESLFVAIGATDFAKNKDADFDLKAITQVVDHPLASDRWAARAYDMSLYKLESATNRRPAVVGALPGNKATVFDYGPTTTNGTDGGVLRKGTATIVGNASMLEVLRAVDGDTSTAPLDSMMMQRMGPGSEAKPCLAPGAPLITTIKGVPTVVGLANELAIVGSNNRSDACGLALGEYIHFYHRLSGKATTDWIKATVGKTGPAKDKKCRGKVATLFGTNASETIIGTGGNDVIFAANGNDRVVGGKGKDVLCGGGGADTLVGGKGKDICDGGKGNDKAKGCETQKKI